jgi:pimeloyl-ACP methyl ester carboxylesterase
MIDFQDRGAGVAVTFAHGFALDHRMWAPQVEHLAKTHRTIAVDLPGFGPNGRETEGPQCPAQAVIDVLDSRGIKKTHLVGHSFGGAVVVDVALANPDRVLSLTLVDGLLLGRSSGIVSWPTAAAFAKQGDNEAAHRAWMQDELFAHAIKNSELAAALEKMVDDYCCGHWNGRTSNTWLCDAPIDRLCELKFPALVVNGEFDSKPFHAMGVEYGERLPNAKKAILPGIGHISNLEAPDAFHALFADLIA